METQVHAVDCALVHLLPRIWEIMTANVWYCHRGLKDNTAVRAIRRVHTDVRNHEFRGCFEANSARSSV